VNNDPRDPELDKMLAAWQVEVRVPEDFQRQVWKRIAAREAANADPSWLTWIKSLFVSGAAVSVPRVALAAVSLGVFIGVTTGILETSRWNAATWNRLENQYVQSVDPYQQVAKL
jgi:hypothetical protein